MSTEKAALSVVTVLFVLSLAAWALDHVTLKRKLASFQEHQQLLQRIHQLRLQLDEAFQSVQQRLDDMTLSSSTLHGPEGEELEWEDFPAEVRGPMLEQMLNDLFDEWEKLPREIRADLRRHRLFTEHSPEIDDGDSQPDNREPSSE